MDIMLALDGIRRAGRGHVIVDRGLSFAQVGGGPTRFVAEFRLGRDRQLWRIFDRRVVPAVSLAKFRITNGVVYVRRNETVSMSVAAAFLRLFVEGRQLPNWLGARDVWQEEME